MCCCLSYTCSRGDSDEVMLFLEAKNSRILDVMSFSANQRAEFQGYTSIGVSYEIHQAGGRTLAFTVDCNHRFMIATVKMKAAPSGVV